MKLTDTLLSARVPLKKFTNYRNRGYIHKVVRIPALKDSVQEKNMKETKAPCVNEMSVMMDCWKRFDFNQTPCTTEISSFHQCMAAAEVEAREQKQRAAQGLPAKGSRMRPSKQVNEVLARYPQPPTNFD